MKLTIGLVFGFGMVWGQVPMKALNPRVEKIVAEVSAERIGGGAKTGGAERLDFVMRLARWADRRGVRTIPASDFSVTRHRVRRVGDDDDAAAGELSFVGFDYFRDVFGCENGG